MAFSVCIIKGKRLPVPGFPCERPVPAGSPSHQSPIMSRTLGQETSYLSKMSGLLCFGFYLAPSFSPTFCSSLNPKNFNPLVQPCSPSSAFINVAKEFAVTSYRKLHPSLVFWLYRSPLFLWLSSLCITLFTLSPKLWL